MELYSQILDHGGPAFRLVLQHIRDNPTQGCLFHCTGALYELRSPEVNLPQCYFFVSGQGSHRSACCNHLEGDLFAHRSSGTSCLQIPCLMQLAGVDNQLIAEDYALTRVGREPAREMIMARLSKEPLFASNNEAALNMFTCR